MAGIQAMRRAGSGSRFQTSRYTVHGTRYTALSAPFRTTQQDVHRVIAAPRAAILRLESEEEASSKKLERDRTRGYTCGSRRASSQKEEEGEGKEQRRIVGHNINLVLRARALSGDTFFYKFPNLKLVAIPLWFS